MESSFKGEKDGTVTINGNVVVKTGSKIKNNVELIGPLIIGENCIIDNNCKLGPNVSIGNNCKISNSIISNSIIMSDCEIINSEKINQSIIAYNSTIKKSENEEKTFLLGEGTRIFL